LPGSVEETKKFLRIKIPEWYMQNALLKLYYRAFMAVMLLLLSVSVDALNVMTVCHYRDAFVRQGGIIIHCE
jgi:hypothetical protein